MPKPLPRWIQNTLASLSPLAGAWFIAERNEKDRYAETKMIMQGDIKADWIRIGMTGNPFTTINPAVNSFMETALGGRASYWLERFKAAKKTGEKRVAARHLAVIEELTKAFMPIEVPSKDYIKQTGDLDKTTGSTGTDTAGQSNLIADLFKMIAPSQTTDTTPAVPTAVPGSAITPAKPWYKDVKVMIPIYLGAAALFYFMYKKR
jgi:hypothetical protein